MKYQNTQVGKVVIIAFVLIFALITVLMTNNPSLTAWLVAIFIGVFAVLFSTLSIHVSKQSIIWFFGPQFWKKEVDITDIQSVNVIRTKWYYGFGIRLIPTGWLYNVSGLDAVELHLKDGKTITLGTNDPYQLEKAINSLLTNSHG